MTAFSIVCDISAGDGGDTGPSNHQRGAQRSTQWHLRDNRARVLVGGCFRLKNATELIGQLKLPKSAQDAEILAAGWRVWGTTLADRLRGAFAFVLKDMTAGTLYAARDAFGQEPMYYARTDEGWLFSGSPRSARISLSTSATIDPLQVADFIMGNVVERSRSFYAEIDRLPAGNWMRIDRSGKVTKQFWAAHMAPRSFDRQNPAERFRELFDDAVAFQASGDRRNGAFVSGGLDSSAIIGSLIANGTPPDDIAGFTRSYRQLPDWSDGKYIDMLKNAFDLPIREFLSDTINPLNHAERVIQAVDGPVQSYGMAAKIPLLEAAHASGIGVLLDGHGGDEIVSYGFGLMNELARSGKWLKLWRATRAPALKHGASRTALMRQYSVHSRYANGLLWRLQARRKKLPAIEEPSPLADHLSALVADDRYLQKEALAKRDHDERQVHEYAVSHPLQQYGQESLMLIGREYGVESRMPFYDRDLAEFSLSLPADLKMRDGMTRVILRDAMKGRLPPQLLRRKGKFDFSYAFANGLLSDRERLMDLTDPRTADLGQYVNCDWLTSLRSRIDVEPGQVGPFDARSIFRIAQLAIWLQMQKR